MQMLAQLIATPSISSVSAEYDQPNRALIDLLAEWSEALGFAVEIIDIPGHPDKANLIATLGEGSGGLVLSGHTDTVPFDEGRWSHDPFQLTEREQRLFGLGTADMKSFFALALEEAREVDPTKLRQPLILLATADEESSMIGAQTLVELGRPKARYAIIGEPTGLRPVNAHKGIMMEAVRLTGRSGHSSDPSLGVNALEGMHAVLGAILAWRGELQGRYRDERFKVPVPTLNLGHIHGGDNPNRICASCELHFDLRPLPGMRITELREELRGRVGEVLADSALQWDVHTLIHATEPMHTDAHAAIVRAAEALTGHPAEAAAYCTEGPYLNALGMETIILGPGYIEQAHQPDEFLALANVQPMLDDLHRLIERFCLQPGT
jgi:acetylornithine deacetylase